MWYKYIWVNNASLCIQSWNRSIAFRANRFKTETKMAEAFTVCLSFIPHISNRKIAYISATWEYKPNVNYDNAHYCIRFQNLATGSINCSKIDWFIKLTKLHKTPPDGVLVVVSHVFWFINVIIIKKLDIVLWIWYIWTY